jgi:SAM-dependent methyltransferase
VDQVTRCRCCDAPEVVGNRYIVRERFFGLGEPFEYFRCAQCGARSIVEVPDDLGRHYPSDYYSFVPVPRTGLRALLRRLRARGHFGGPFALLARLSPDPRLDAVARVTRDKRARILDVGSGSGGTLEALADAGFTSLDGVDPFLGEGRERTDRIRVRRLEVGALGDERFDLVMLNHVLEHHPHPVTLLRDSSRVLSERGRMIVRVPLADSWASETYGEFWVGHDAPRHLAVPTHEAMQRMAASAGLRITSVWHDSSDFQMWVSEAYQRGERLVGQTRGSGIGVLERLRNPEARRQSRQAARLNRERKGDQGVFVLEPLERMPAAR